MRGNCDSEVDQMLLHFPITAPWQQVLLEKPTVCFLTHGHLFGPENLPALNQNDVLVYGHTHLPVAEQRGRFSTSTPGSVSIPKGGNPASYGMLDNDVLSVIALNDQSIIAQVAINP
ncbi:putative phosphodiesterase [Escherichia coli]|uniref:Phosphoesterase n=1 Tax=Escherichia coli TaxID=562 RepID=A0A2X3LT77_ECOLX|nr:putative phosphodiesterase [Escherichia coli]